MTEPCRPGLTPTRRNSNPKPGVAAPRDMRGRTSPTGEVGPRGSLSLSRLRPVRPSPGQAGWSAVDRRVDVGGRGSHASVGHHGVVGRPDGRVAVTTESHEPAGRRWDRITPFPSRFRNGPVADSGS